MDYIARAGKGDELYGCFYEFHQDEILQCFREAAEKGVSVHIIYDAKDNQHIDSKTGKVIASFPKTVNEAAIERAGLKGAGVQLYTRERNKSYISHNKFLVLKRKGKCEVMFGSTNLSSGGLYGQTNVMHYSKDKALAEDYLHYWKQLSGDPAIGMHTVNGFTFAVEIVVTNDVSNAKAKKIESFNLPTLRIDLSSFYKLNSEKCRTNPDFIKLYLTNLLTDIKRKSWVIPPTWESLPTEMEVIRLPEPATETRLNGKTQSENDGCSTLLPFVVIAAFFFWLFGKGKN